MKAWTFLTLVFAASAPISALACSTLLLSTQKTAVLGRNLDWDFGHGLVVVNRRGLHKSALIGAPFTPAQWVSKYGSITFNQVAQELPYGGMNERGLDVEALWLRSAQFPETHDRPAVNELQWVQYQLDNFSSVAEVVSHLKTVNPIRKFAKLHYFVCDSTSTCAVIDPIAGQLSVHTGKSLPSSVLTNDTYEDSIAYANRLASKSGASSVPVGNKSLNRFARLYFLANSPRKNGDASPEAAFDDLKKVASDVSNDDDEKTQWSIVSDLKNQVIRFKSSDAPSVKLVRLSQIDFSCAGQSKALDINSNQTGDVTEQLTVLSKERNLRIATQSLVNGFAHLPPAAIEKLVNYPESLTCHSK